jgi:hypothetical protein
MKYYTFFRADNNFDDINDDEIIQKYADFKVTWLNHLMIGINVDEGYYEQYASLLVLKYGEDMVNNLVKDFSPKAGVDYYIT